MLQFLPYSCLGGDRAGAFATSRARWIPILALVLVVPALVRVAESWEGLSDPSNRSLLVALRWRLWDWWFWIPATPIVWRLVRRGFAMSATPARIGIEHLGLFIVLLVGHRFFSLTGMLLFWPGASPSILIDARALHFGEGLTDLLTYAALAIGCAALHLQRMRAEPAAVTVEPSAAPPAPIGVLMEAIHVRRGNQQYTVRFSAVRWIQADGYCTRLFDGERSHLVRQTMSSLEVAIDPRCFMRVHRSAIVNLQFARELRYSEHGSHALVLADGTELPVSRSKYRLLKDRLASF